MYHLDLKREFAVEQNLGMKNLLVSGCSFTKNVSSNSIDTWPYYLRDLGGFENVYDCSWPGCGNYHIHNSIINAIETEPDLTPDNTVVVVMWSGYDRDDFVIDPRSLSRSAFLFNKEVGSGYTGGLLGSSNLMVNIENIKKIKSPQSRALENYMLMQSLAGYITARGFKYVFTEFSTPGKMLDANIDPVLYLPQPLQQRFIDLVRNLSPNIGDWSLPELNHYRDNKEGDGYHPHPKQHLDWTRSVLLPYLTTN